MNSLMRILTIFALTTFTLISHSAYADRVRCSSEGLEDLLSVPDKFKISTHQKWAELVGKNFHRKVTFISADLEDYPSGMTLSSDEYEFRSRDLLDGEKSELSRLTLTIGIYHDRSGNRIDDPYIVGIDGKHYPNPNVYITGYYPSGISLRRWANCTY